MKFYFYRQSFKTLKTPTPVKALRSEWFCQSSAMECDYWVYPFYLYDKSLPSVSPVAKKINKGCKSLQYWDGRDHRHVIYEFNDPDVQLRLNCHKFRTSVISKTREPKTYSIPYPQREVSYKLFSGNEIRPVRLVSFCGDKNSWHRKKMIKKARVRFGNHVEIISRDRVFGDIALRKRAGFHKDYRRSILESQFILCPRGGGPSSKRLFEVMAAGRVPVIISPGYVKPFEHNIDWSLFSIHTKRIDAAFNAIEGIDSSKADQMGQLAREVWYDYIQDCMWWKSIKPILEGAFGDKKRN